MADLIDRISGESEPARPKLNLHLFIAGLRFYAEGMKTKAEIATEFGLQGDEVTQAEALADLIDDESTALNKMRYVARVEAIGMCMEDDSDVWYHSGGAIDKSTVFADLGLT